MNLGDALALIGMKVAWMQYAQRLAAEESFADIEVDGCSAEEFVQVYVDPVYRWDGSRV